MTSLPSTSTTCTTFDVFDNDKISLDNHIMISSVCVSSVFYYFTFSLFLLLSFLGLFVFAYLLAQHDLANDKVSNASSNPNANTNSSPNPNPSSLQADGNVIVMTGSNLNLSEGYPTTKRKTWIGKRRSLIMFILYYCSRVVLTIFFLLGLYHPTKYLLVVLPTLIYVGNHIVLLFDWTKLMIEKANKLTKKTISHEPSTIKKILFTIYLLFVIIYITSCCITSMVFFHDPQTLNWFSSLGVSIISLLALFFCFFLSMYSRAISRQLLQLAKIKQHHKVLELNEELCWFSSRVMSLCFVLIPMVFIPSIWAFITIVDDNHGMQYYNLFSMYFVFLPEMISPFYYAYLCLKDLRLRDYSDPGSTNVTRSNSLAVEYLESSSPIEPSSPRLVQD